MPIADKSAVEVTRTRVRLGEGQYVCEVKKKKDKKERERQTDRQTDRQTETHTETETEIE